MIQRNIINNLGKLLYTDMFAYQISVNFGTYENFHITATSFQIRPGDISAPLRPPDTLPVLELCRKLSRVMHPSEWIHKSNFLFAGRGQLEDLEQPFVGRRSGPDPAGGAYSAPRTS